MGEKPVIDNLRKPAGCFGSVSRFQLYNLVFEKLAVTRKEMVIRFYNDEEESFLYNRRDEIRTGKPVLITEPKSGPVFDQLGVEFGSSGWTFALTIPFADPKVKWDTPMCYSVKDPHTDSIADVSYELFSKSIEAGLKIEVEDSQHRERIINIISGEISTFTNEDDTTKCLLQSFEYFPHNLRKRERSIPPQVCPGKPIPLARPVLAVPLYAVLYVGVDLLCSFSLPSKQMKPKPKDEVKSGDADDFQIRAQCFFYTQTSPGKEVKQMKVCPGGPKGLKVKAEVTWFDSVLGRYPEGKHFVAEDPIGMESAVDEDPKILESGREQNCQLKREG